MLEAYYVIKLFEYISTTLLVKINDEKFNKFLILFPLDLIEFITYLKF